MARATSNPEVIDRSVLAHLEWRRHAESVRTAWMTWTEAAGTERTRRFAAYLEELDREQRACELLRDVVAQDG